MFIKNGDGQWFKEYRFKWKVYDSYALVSYEDYLEYIAGMPITYDMMDRLISNSAAIQDIIRREFAIGKECKDPFEGHAIFQKWFLIPTAETHRDYFPMEEYPNLFFEFAALGGLRNKLYVEKLEGATLKWISKFGLLWEKPREATGYYEGYQRLENGSHQQSYSKSYMLFPHIFTEATIAWQALNAYKCYIDQDFESANQYSSNTSPEAILAFLYNMVEVHLNGVCPIIQVETGEKTGHCGIRPGWKVPDLISAMWLQFYWHITNCRPLNRCLDCGSLFAPTVSDQKFCPPWPGQKQSSCANRYYVRQHRDSKRMS